MKSLCVTTEENWEECTEEEAWAEYLMSSETESNPWLLENPE